MNRQKEKQMKSTSKALVVRHDGSMRTVCAVALTISACLLLAACGKKSGDEVKLPEDKSPVTAPADPTVRVVADLPFAAEVDISFGSSRLRGRTAPQGAMSTVAAGEWDPGTGIFETPIHPLGTIKSLELYGKDIPLTSNELKDGLLSTAGFGEIEVFLKGFVHGQALLEYRALPPDIAKLKKACPTQAK